MVEAVAGRGKFIRNGRATTIKVRLTPFAPEDLDLHLEMGLTALQVGRMLRLIEEAYAQDALLSAKQVGMLSNLTPTALRNRLQILRNLGLWVPMQGLSKDARERGGMLRSTWAMAKYLAGEAPGEIRQAAAISRERWREIKYRFGTVARLVLEGDFEPRDPETAGWVELIRRTPKSRLEPLMQEAPA
jgi:hypothetical protein